jgi:hypothetical protein
MNEMLAAWLEGTPDWQAMLSDWQARQAVPSAPSRPAPTDVLSSQALALAGLGPGAGSEGELRLRLALPVEPFYANGTWDAAKHELAWRTDLPGPARTPFLAYASWAEPETARQTQCFGRVVLRAAQLAEYVLWWHGLEKVEAAEWEAFLDRLSPHGEPAARLAEFRFDREMAAGPPTEESLAASRVQPARKLLLDALQEAARAPAVP